MRSGSGGRRAHSSRGHAGEADLHAVTIGAASPLPQRLSGAHREQADGVAGQRDREGQRHPDGVAIGELVGEARSEEGGEQDGHQPAAEVTMMAAFLAMIDLTRTKIAARIRNIPSVAWSASSVPLPNHEA